MDILTLIKTRRSVRKFKKGKISQALVKKILEAGRWAPSGLNNQPWRFMVLENERKDALARYTRYDCIIRDADKIILVFLDKTAVYHCEKDRMAIGACIQNMLLVCYSLGLGACWIGEILNKRKDVQNALKLKKTLELEAVIALGWPQKKEQKGTRKAVKDLLI